MGAETLDKSQIDGRIMINLDSEEEGVATVSCAGGVVVTYTRPITREHKSGSTLTLEISGLLGGHSGADIHLERGNGNLIMARIVERLMAAGEPALVSFNGGTKDNAINRECKAVLVYKDHAAAEAGAELARSIADAVSAELEVYDPGFSCALAIADDAEVEAINEDTALAFVRTLRLAPNGVMPATSRRAVPWTFLQHRRGRHFRRRGHDSAVPAFLHHFPAGGVQGPPADARRRSGLRRQVRVRVSGLELCRASPVRDVFLESYRTLFGTELRIESIHAGLECGLFAEALDGLDAIAVGPTLKDVHTPDESMELASSERFYTLLVDVLKRLAA